VARNTRVGADRAAGDDTFGYRCGDFGRDHRRAGISGQHVLNAELTKAALGFVVARRDQSDDCHPRRRKAGERIAVEPAQISGQDHRAGSATGRRGQQIREVDTAPDHADPEILAFEGRHQIGLPNAVGHRGEDGNIHGDAVPVGDPNGPADPPTAAEAAGAGL
jgi:hypothetical protein